MSKKIKITAGIISALIILAVIAFFALTTKAERRFGMTVPKSPTTDVIGTVYDVRSDFIINMPEDYILDLSKSAPTYDEVVEELGEPSGKYGFGICRAYWRIGERKYAEYVFMGDAPFLEIREY
ncbi:hypothetical protein [Ruminococcus sp.]|uniref:hypothetical protein n=1 Tax=Ruminococcus sp. TaxID=41978 RepID=UPI0025D9D129|nr:hypothetical protein [Ruminococcus sp.]MBQ8966304.1 hypothetical protein [Ruminococcus sp.]